MYRSLLFKSIGDLFYKIIHKGILVVVVSLLLAQSGCKIDTITTGSVNDDVYIKQKNQSLFLKVAGYVGSRKLLLIVHGGPGGNSLDYRDALVTESLEKEIAVAYWDQRNSGKSQGNGGDKGLEAYRDDFVTIVKYLKAKYGEDLQIYVMGHSWGGFLTPYFLGYERNQDLVKGWIQVDGAHNYPMNDSLTQDMLYKRAEYEIKFNTDSSKAARWQAIFDYCKSHDLSQGYDVSVQLNQFAYDAESYIDSVNSPVNFSRYEESASYKHNDFNGAVSGILRIDEPTYSVNPDSYLGKIQIPTLMLWGRFDFVCPKMLSDDLWGKIGSSDKTRIIFDHSGHSPMVNEPYLFWTTVLEWISQH